MRSRWTLSVALLAVVAVGVAGVVWLVLRRGTPPGTQVEASLVLLDDADEQVDRTVRLPTGTLTVSTSRPLRELPAGITSVDDHVAGFGRWVAVGWQVRSATGPATTAMAVAGDRTQFSVTVVADGQRHDLDAGRTRGGRPGEMVRYKSVYLALPADPDELTIEIGYAGLVQTLDPATGELRAGAAEPLYAAAGPWSTRAPACRAGRTEIDAPGFESSDGDVTVSCQVAEAYAVPYVTGHGWAQPGRTWLVVPVSTNVLGSLFVYWPSVEADPHALYRMKLRSSTLTVAGRPPAALLPYYRGTQADLLARDMSGAYYVFDVAPTDRVVAVLTQAYAGDPLDGAPPGSPRQARGTLRLEITAVRI